MDVDTYFSEQSEQGRLSGAVLVRQAGRTLLDKGYGAANRESGRRNTPRTEFQIASVSKQFTAAAILLLQEQGRLSLRDRIEAWAPNSPEAWRSITIHQLLAHTSGIGHWDDYPDLSLYEPKSREELFGIFQSKPLVFAPGSSWAYSSPAYVLLAHIVEQVSRERYAAFLRNAIFAPLGMTDTGVGQSSPRPDVDAMGYAGEDVAPSFELENIGIGAGDIWSTTGDMARWDTALIHHGLLSEDSVREMIAGHAGVAAWEMSGLTDVHYGYGIARGTLYGHDAIFHSGGNSGFVCFNTVLLDDDTVIIVLLNDEQLNPGEISMRIAREVLEIEPQHPA